MVVRQLRRRARNAALVLAFLPLTGAANASTIYVRSSATGANNGSSWAAAYPDLQSALAAAGPGDEVWVAVGTYKPTAGTDRNATFQLKSGVNVRGGFDGAELSPSERPADPDPQSADPATDTILSGD